MLRTSVISWTAYVKHVKLQLSEFTVPMKEFHLFEMDAEVISECVAEDRGHLPYISYTVKYMVRSVS
jgi:hypothetical protein